MFRVVEPDLTRFFDHPLRVEWSLLEYGKPDVYLMYPNAPSEPRDTRVDHVQRWAVVRFGLVMFFRVHDPEFVFEPTEYEPISQPRPEPLYAADDSPLKEWFLAGNIHVPGRGLYPLGFPSTTAADLKHYRLSLDHDVVIDILGLEAEVSTETVACAPHPSGQ